MNKLETTKIDIEWFERLQNRGFTRDSVYGDGRYEELKLKLLDIGGEAVSLIVNLQANDRYSRLLNDGQLFKTAVRTAVDGSVVSEKVNNLINKRPNTVKYAGFSLISDGVWRYYEWGVDSTTNQVIETMNPQLAYYGIPNFWD